MPTIFSSRKPQRCARITSFSIGVVLIFAATAGAQLTQVYSFEPDIEGFALAGGGVTVSLETSGLGATHGMNSLKLEYADFSSFAGAKTTNIHPAFNDPLGLDFVRFDFTNTTRFVPPMPVPGVTPTFANASVTFFGDLPGNPVQPAQIQYFLSEVPIGALEPGTHEITIDLRNEGGQGGMGGGLNTDTGMIKGYDAWVDAGFVPSEFQIYINKNGRFGDPTFAWTVFIDNIQVGRFLAAVQGDYNGNGTVDAADYVLWRNGGPLLNEVADPGTISNGDYTEWRARFGNTSGGGNVVTLVPEPASMLLLVIGAIYAIGLAKRRSTC